MDLKGGGEGRGPLSRQGSIYSLTFDEFQSTLGGVGGGGGPGKDFGSMNMDELLRSIWTAEESQAMASTSAAAAPGDALQRQGSLTLPRTLSVKTVDEVWRDFVREGGGGGGGGGAEPQPGRQPTLGEMTLEEFLVKAGVVRENPAAAAAVAAAAAPQVAPRPIQAVNNGSTIFFGNFGGANGAGAGTMGFAPVGIGDPAMGNGMMPGVAGIGAPAVSVSPVDTAMAQMDSVGKGELSSPSAPMPYPFEGVVRGRRSTGGVEKVVERRQRRMIKNRESAARSRARKQAYTMELEAEVQKLKEQNAELQKKQDEMMEMQKNQRVI
ncbi:hypothetical protein ACP4OV_017816 [Aristida adscensionis]